MKQTALCTTQCMAPVISTALGLGWKTHHSQQRKTDTWRMQDEYLFLWCYSFLNFWCIWKQAIAVLNLKGRGKISSTFEFSSSFQLWDDSGTLSLQWCMIFPGLCYSLLYICLIGFFSVLIKEKKSRIRIKDKSSNTACKYKVISKHHLKLCEN